MLEKPKLSNVDELWNREAHKAGVQLRMVIISSLQLPQLVAMLTPVFLYRFELKPR
jgi:hypothetical protein